MFIVQKDSGIIPQILTQILDNCVNGVTLADPDLEDTPIVYAKGVRKHDGVYARRNYWAQLPLFTG